MNNIIYDVDYFIKKFEAIPESEIGTGSLIDKCALYHCGVKLDQNSDYTRTPEADALKELIEPGGPISYIAVIELNDFTNKDTYYYGSTPKQRILNRLKEIKGEFTP